MNWFERHLAGHLSIGPLVIYGFNAMHVAVNLWTRRWGWLCFHPPMYVFGRWWPWYFYASPDATSNRATVSLGRKLT